MEWVGVVQGTITSSLNGLGSWLCGLASSPDGMVGRVEQAFTPMLSRASYPSILIFVVVYNVVFSCEGIYLILVVMPILSNNYNYARFIFVEEWASLKHDHGKTLDARGKVHTIRLSFLNLIKSCFTVFKWLLALGPPEICKVSTPTACAPIPVNCACQKLSGQCILLGAGLPLLTQPTCRKN